jgi:hypothetical protein
MRIVDQGQAKVSDAMVAHRERGFAQDLIDKTMALRVAAGAVDLTRKASCPYPRYGLRVFPRHLSARASHEIHLQSTHGA